jgi:hypothetical protein
MPARAGFNYALIRVVPRVEREEFVNVGAIVYSPTRRFLAAKVALDRTRLKALGGGTLDLDLIEQHVNAIPAICAGDTSAGPMASLPVSDRFHWLVSPRSTVVQISPVHSGVTEDLAAALDHLMNTMVRAPA